MLNAAEAARRRELHQRVYAPGGALTDAEITELHDLDNRHLTALVALPEPAAPPEPVAPLEPAEQPVRGAQHAASGPEVAARRDPRAEDGDEPELALESEPAQVPGTPAHPRRRWLLPVIAVAAILAGLAFGRFVLGSAADAVALDAAQQKTWAQLEASDKYTPGSVSLLGSKYGVDLWQVHRTETDVECMVLTHAEAQTESCGLLEPDQGDTFHTAALDYMEDGVDYSVYASVARDILGNPISVLQRYANEEWDWRSMYSDAELMTVHVLETAGFDGESLSIIGYDGDIPVWVYQNERYCLMVVRDGVVAQQCAESGADSSQTLTLDASDAEYTLQPGERRGPALVITRRPDVSKEG